MNVKRILMLLALALLVVPAGCIFSPPDDPDPESSRPRNCRSPIRPNS